MHRLDWSDLQYILAVANHGSLAAAARALGVNHSTVQRRITSFEELHSTTIFDRRPDGYKLTEEGHLLLEAARAVESAVWSLERKITGKDLRLEGEIRLTTTDTLLHTIVGQEIKRFHQYYPGIQFQVSTTNSILSISRRDADVAIRPSPSPPDSLVGEQAGSFNFHIYASPEFADRNTGVAVENLDWLAPDYTMADSTPGKWMQQSLPRARVILTADNLSGLASAAAFGLGAVLLPCYLGDRRPDLVRLESDLETPSNSLWLLTHPDLSNATRIHTFMDYMVRAMKQHLNG